MSFFPLALGVVAGHATKKHNRKQTWLTGDNRESGFPSCVLPHPADAYALAYRITGSHADADDVLQEACLRAFRAVGDVVDSSARSWVMTIMRNAAFTWIRKNRPSAVFAVDDLEEVEVAQTDPGDSGLEMLLIAKSVTWRPVYIAALPDPFRETVILRDLHGLSYRGDCRANEGAYRDCDVAVPARAQPVSHPCGKKRGITELVSRLLKLQPAS